MLYEDITTSAIVVGYRIGFENDSATYEDVEAIETAVEKANQEFGLQLRLFVPSDTTDTGTGEAYGAVLGRALVESECYAGPQEFAPKTLMEGLAAFPKVPEGYWTMLQECECFGEVDGSGRPQLLLMSWGPLCYGAVYIGQARTSDESDAAKYKFIANQDMNQEWTYEGLDGQSIDMFVEFDDIRALDFSRDAQLKHRERVPDIDEPTYFLVCRYD